MKKSDESLAFINEVSKTLESIGNCRIVYITAELKPFSNHFRPDLYFESFIHPKPIFIEYKQSLRTVSSDYIIKELTDNLEYVNSTIDTEFDYIFMTGESLKNEIIEKLSNAGISAFGEVNDTKRFYYLITNFSSNNI